MTEEDYLMWLSRISGVGAKRYDHLLKIFGSAKFIWESSSYDMKSVRAIPEVVIDEICKSKDKKILEGYIKELEKKDIKFISCRNEKFPHLLKNIPNPPMGIYVKGKLPDDELIKVSIIGSRDCSNYGAMAAYKMAKDLSKNNIVVVSGMAIGADSMAHKGALEAGGKTIAVLGSGVDICYPSENMRLYREIAEKGAIISEYPPGTRSSSKHFPKRNRIVSGMSKALIVTEAAGRSGTMITVNQALDQGRDVYAVPGNITSELSVGTNAFIKEGAQLITSYKDIMESLGLPIVDLEAETIKKMENLAPDEKLVYDCMSFEPITVDELVFKMDIKLQKMQYILTILESNGLVQKLAGQRYIHSL